MYVLKRRFMKWRRNQFFCIYYANARITIEFWKINGEACWRKPFNELSVTNWGVVGLRYVCVIRSISYTFKNFSNVNKSSKNAWMFCAKNKFLKEKTEALHFKHWFLEWLFRCRLSFDWNSVFMNHSKFIIKYYLAWWSFRDAK